MKMRCLLLAPRSSMAQPLATSLEAAGFTVDLHTRLEDATEALTEGGPEVVLVDLYDHAGLELMATAESLRLRTVFLMLRRGSWNRAMPFALSPYLRVYGLDSGEHAWRSQIGEAVENAARARGKTLFRLSDYVELAVLAELSVALLCRPPTGDAECLVEIVGGDVWNVFAGELEGQRALTSVLLDSPRDIGISALRTVPQERQIRDPGWELLSECARRIAGAPPPAAAGDQTALGTRPVSLREVAALVEEENRKNEENRADSFDALLDQGFGAALARDYARAAAAFEKALELRPDDARVKFNLDKVRQKLADRE